MINSSQRAVLLVAADPVRRVLIIIFPMNMEAISSSEAPILTAATLRPIPEDDILHSHRCKNLKFYIALTGWTL
jgi:hypothetical protein